MVELVGTKTHRALLLRNKTTKLIKYLAVEDASSEIGWAESPLVVEAELRGEELDFALESATVVLDEFWFPQVPPFLELLQHFLDLLVNAFLVVGLQSDDLGVRWAGTED